MWKAPFLQTLKATNGYSIKLKEKQAQSDEFTFDYSLHEDYGARSIYWWVIAT